MFRTLWNQFFGRRLALARAPIGALAARPFNAELVGIHVANTTATTGRRFGP